MSQIRETIEKYDSIIPRKPKEQMESLFRSLEINVHELCLYQERKSLAFANGVIDQELAIFIFNKLGDWEHATLAERITLTQAMVRIIKETR